MLTIILFLYNYAPQIVYTFDSSNGGHTGIISSIVSLDAQHLLASGSWDATVKIWNLTTGTLIYTFDSSNGGHTKNVNCLAYLGNNLLASSSDDATVKIWNVSNGSLERTLNESNSVNWLVLLRNGLLAANVNFGIVHIWNFTSGLQLKSITTPNLLFFYMTALDNNLLGVCQNGGLLLVYNMTDFTLLYEFSHGDHVTQVKQLPNNLIASTSFDATVRVWNLTSGSMKYNFNSANGGHTNVVNNLDVLSSKDAIASSSRDTTVKVWNITTGTLMYTIVNAALGNSIGNSNVLLCFNRSDMSIQLWDEPTGTLDFASSIPATWTQVDAAISIGNNLFAHGGHDSTVKVWQMFGENFGL